MARGKKDQKVGVIEHASGLMVDIMFNPNNGQDSGLTFNASVGGTRMQNKNADELRIQVVKFIDDNIKLEWIPVIEVRETHPFCSNGSYIGLDLDRYYLANTVDPRIIRRLDWQNYTTIHGEKQTELGRLNYSSEFNAWHGDVKALLPHVLGSKDRDQITYLLYDEATWTALNAIADGIQSVKDKLRDIMGSEEGRSKLIQVGAQLLNLLPENT